MSAQRETCVRGHPYDTGVFVRGKWQPRCKTCKAMLMRGYMAKKRPPPFVGPRYLNPKIVARFWSHVERGSEGACWLWRGSKSKRGYGVIQINRRKVPAHRVSYEIANCVSVPVELCVLHHPIDCNRTSCVNPAHLRTGTYADNNRDMLISGTHPMASRTMCKMGHPFDSIDNLGRRGCRRCKQAYSKEWKRRRKLEAANG